MVSTPRPSLIAGAVWPGVCLAAAVVSWTSSVRPHPEVAVRGAWRSAAFAPPTMVVPHGLESGLRTAVRTAFPRLHENAEGRELLPRLGIRRFVTARSCDYRAAIDVRAQRQRRGGATP